MAERVLVILAADLHVRNVVSSGALDEIEGEILIASSAQVNDDSLLREHPGFQGSVREPRLSRRFYRLLELHSRAVRRDRSITLATKLSLERRPTRAVARLAALPGVRRIVDGLLRLSAGRNPEIDRLFDATRPDVLLAPTGGNDPIVNQAIRVARRRGVPSLAAMINWDGLTSKGALLEQPDRLAVWGARTAADAERVHGLAGARIEVIGSPTLDRYYHPPDRFEPAPFQQPYVLVAGCYAPYDEAALVAQLRRAREELGAELTLVYRPHPFRAPRRRPDRVADGPGLVVDPAVLDAYEASFSASEQERRQLPFPALAGYPSLLHHAAFVVSPFSTMVLEAALAGRPVIAVAADDGVNAPPMSTVSRFDHFAGVGEIDGVTVAQSHDELRRRFGELVEAGATAAGSPDPDLDLTVSGGPLTYRRRLAQLIRVVTIRPN